MAQLSGRAAEAVFAWDGSGDRGLSLGSVSAKRAAHVEKPVLVTHDGEQPPS